MDKRIHTALISVYNKTELEGILDTLTQLNVRIISTGGTWQYINSLSIKAEKVEDLTQFPSILGGRVKTLHPAIFGGILNRRDNATDQQELQQHEIEPIDLVIVDLYPFEETLRTGADEEALIEQIDIGGVSLLRAAAKNYHDTLVVSSHTQYAPIGILLQEQKGRTTLAQRHSYATAAFERTACYDAAIAQHFAQSSLKSSHTHEQQKWPSVHLFPAQQGTALRYGENPHQKALFCGDMESMFTQLHGKELSYNNILDLDAGLGLIDEFDVPTFAILKHGTPCGLASGFSLCEAWEKALACDPQSAFGGILLTNRPIDQETAAKMDAIFFEVCLAPDFTEDAIEILTKRKNRILLRRGCAEQSPYTARSALNGYLLQSRDTKSHQIPLGECVTLTTPTAAQERDLLFANRAVKHCKSNAVAIALNGQLIGVGAGETSRVDAVQHAIEKARANGHSPEGAVLASDAFFPFADSVIQATAAGIKAFVQPGGSVRDQESIDECNNQNASMIFTGHRHFKH